MDIAKKIRHLLVEESKTVTDLAKDLGTSHQNLSAKLKRNNLNTNDLLAIADALGYKLDIKFIKINQGK